MESVVDTLRERNPVAAVRFVEAAQATFEHVAFMPFAYPELATQRPALAGMRWRPLTGSFDRYLVFYRVTDGGVVIVVRVLHSARDLDHILGED
jgi:plasmid stabilization system protein ParE